MPDPSLSLPSAPVCYQVALHDVRTHLYHVTLTIARPAAQQQVSLPVWIPGSYLVREFAKNLHSLQAEQDGQPCALVQCNKHRWRITCTPGLPLVLRYTVSAYDSSVRTAWLDQQRGFFNGTSLLLRVIGQEQQPQQLRILPPDGAAQEGGGGGSDWELATALQPLHVDARGFGLYQAAHYDELVDSPVEMGRFWSGSFLACGVPHCFVVAGAPPTFDGARLLADTQAICEAHIRFWHPGNDGDGDGAAPAHDRYVFMLNATHEGYGGLEHSHSTALMCSRADLPRQGASTQPEGYITLLGLISHEYFHTWNVKRLRPAQLLPYDYDQENYTELLWFFEGLTSYYDDLLLVRAGLLEPAAYLKLLGKTLNQVLQTPGRRVQSVAQASFDAWVKFYRQDAHTANHTVSYYGKGALVGLCLDLQLRREGHSLDALMRLLWQRCLGSGLQEADVLAALYVLTGRSWQPELAAWVHGCEELPLDSLLPHFGVSVQTEAASPAQTLGLRVQEGQSITLSQVLRGSAAEQAGMMPGDEWYGLEIPSLPSTSNDPISQAAQGWRIGRLADLALYANPGQHVTALVARDRQLLRLPLHLPDAPTTPTLARLQVDDASALAPWLGQPQAATPRPDTFRPSMSSA